MTKKLTRPLTEAEWNALLDKRVQKHIAIEVRKVARRWHLNTEEAKELCADVLVEVAMKASRYYDATRSKLYTFVQEALSTILKNWKRQRDYYSKLEVLVGDLMGLDLAEEGTNQTERDVLNALNLLAYEKEEDASMLGKTPFEILAEKEDREYTWLVISKLSPLNRRICLEYINAPSLNDVARNLHITWGRFYWSIWPACQKEFKKNWGSEEVFPTNRTSRV